MFKLGKEEKPLALVAFLVFALKNPLTIYKYHDLFTREGFRGYLGVVSRDFSRLGV